MDWGKVLHSWLLHTLIILIITFIVGDLFKSIFYFKLETLLWLTSTIIQAFGAMLVLILTVSLYTIGKLNEHIRNLMMAMNKVPKTSLEGLTKALTTITDKKKTFAYRMVDPIQAIAVLIVTSLVIMMFIDKDVVVDESLNAIIVFIFYFLVIYSIYCLQLIIFRVTSLLYEESKF